MNWHVTGFPIKSVWININSGYRFRIISVKQSPRKAIEVMRIDGPSSRFNERTGRMTKRHYPAILEYDEDSFLANFRMESAP